MPINRTPPQTNAASAKTIFRFEVQLRNGPISPEFLSRNPKPPERIIDIQGSQTLEDLHLAIFEAFDRYDEHMYEFQIGGKKPMDRKAVLYGIVDEYIEDDTMKDASSTSIDSLRLKTGSRFFYWFDFGDDWWHEVRLLALNTPEKGGEYPYIVEKKGESPPQYIDWDEEEAAANAMAADHHLAESAVTAREQARLVEISGLMKDFCESHLTGEYVALCDNLFAAVRAAWLPWQRGKAQSWAAAIVHAAGMINFLHDRTFEPYMKLRDIAQPFGVSPATMENKSRDIRDSVNAFPLDPRFCLPSLIQDSPLVWIRPMNGLLVDFRSQPREVQEEALKAGLIPFIPEPLETPARQQQEISQEKTDTAKKKTSASIKKTDQYPLLE